MDGQQQHSASRGSNDNSRDDTMRISSSSFLSSLPQNTYASSSFGPIRSISSLKAHRGPYSRPSAFDKDSRYSPYAKKPMQVRATKIANETPNINLTSTAERIIQTLAICSTPVVDIKKSPIESLKSLKPEFPVFRRDKSGPPVVRSSFDTTPTPYKSINKLPADLPKLVKEQPKNTAHVDTQTLISEIFPSVENFNAEPEQQAAGGSGDNVEGSSYPTTEFFEPSGRINLTNVKFEGWSLDKYTTNNNNNNNINEESSDSSSEDEDGNPYIKAPNKISVQSEKTANVESTVTTTSSTTQKWECPTCMIQAGVHEPVCPCCQTPNPHLKSKPAPVPSTEKWECPTCMVSAGMHEAVCPCCSTQNPHLKSNPATVSGSSSISQPANASPFTFGFQAGATGTTKTTTAGSTFKFGDEQKSNSLVTNFKLGFNSATNPAQATKSTYSFGVNAPNAPPQITFGFGSDRSPEKEVDKSKNAASVQSDVLDFAKKSAKEEVWECPSCMVMNKKSQTKCACCQELQPTAKPQSTTKSDNIVPLTTKQSNSPAFGSSSMPPPSTIPKQTSAFPAKDRPKMVFGLKPEDEMSSEAPVVEPAKPNPFSSFTFGMQKTSSQADTSKPAPSSNEMWSCSLCTAMNNGNNERCSGCGGSKPRSIPQPPSPQTGSQYEKYTFKPFYGIDPDNANKVKSEPDSMFKSSTLVSQPFVIPQLVTAAPSTAGFNFGASTIPTPASAPVVASGGFKFGSTTAVSGEAMKRKADESSETGSGSSGGFNFTGSSEPKLKLRASGAETPTPAPSIGLKSGSVLDALKQPGFGNVDKPDGTAVSAATNQLQTSSTFTFPTSAPTLTTAASIQPPAPTPGVFQFGSTTSNPAVSGGFSFGGLSSHSQASAPPQVFGGSMQTNHGGFNFGQTTMSAPSGQNTFAPPAFSMTPNTNFGAAPAWDANTSNPYNFQSPPSQGGAAAPRRIRKAVRRTK